MKRVVISVAFGLGLVLVLPAVAARASWVSNHCDGTHASDVYVKRSEAQAYSAVAVGEGYEWGGGCWNDNDKDDTPGAPDSGGEGADCSGLTFKTWEMKNSMHKSGWEYWERLDNVHGPYSSYDFHSPEGADPFFKLKNKNVSTTIYMDAFAKAGHVAMIYVDGDAPDGTDLMVEALSDANGMGLFYESYRSQSEYIAVRREDWTDDCFPWCGQSPSPLVVLP